MGISVAPAIQINIYNCLILYLCLCYNYAIIFINYRLDTKFDIQLISQFKSIQIIRKSLENFINVTNYSMSIHALKD